jgi:hypothetical protein
MMISMSCRGLILWDALTRSGFFGQKSYSTNLLINYTQIARQETKKNQKIVFPINNRGFGVAFLSQRINSHDIFLPMNDDTITELLHSTTRCRKDVQGLAAKMVGLDAERYNHLLVDLIDQGADKPLGILLNVAAINKIRLAPQLLADSLKTVDVLLDVSFPYRYQGKDGIEPLLTVALAEDLSWERQALAALLAAELTLKFEQPRQPVKKILWQLATDIQSLEARILISSALSLIDSENVAGDDPKMIINQDILKALPKERPPIVIGEGGTVRRPVAKLGRNDPCHCGSGKKYKKCCWRQDEEVLRDASSYKGISRTQLIAEPALIKDTAPLEEMRPAALKKLRPALMNDEQLLVGYRRADNFGLRDLAFAMLLELKSRPDKEELALGHMVDLFHEAFRNQEKELVQQLARQIPEDDPLLGDIERLQFEISENPDRYLQLEALCRRELVSADTEWELPLSDLCYAFEKIYPALSTVFGRAAIVSSPERTFDNETLLEVIKRNRIYLDLEPWGDPIEEFLDWSIEENHERSLDQAKDRKIEQLKEQLGAARDKAALAGRELRSKELDLAGLEKKIVAAEQYAQLPKPPPTAPRDQPASETSARVDDHRQQVILLKKKIGLLKGEITSHQESRRQYRRQLQEAEQVIAKLADSQPGTPENSAPREDPVLAESVPKKALIPEYTDAFRKSCENLPPAIVAKGIQAAAGFAVRNQATLRQAAALERLSGVFRLRVGIHYRLLVRQTTTDTLEIMDLIPRAQLENWIRHHAP